MDALFVLLLLVVIAIPIAVVGLGVGYVRLARRVEALEADRRPVVGPVVGLAAAPAAERGPDAESVVAEAAEADPSDPPVQAERPISVAGPWQPVAKTVPEAATEIPVIPKRKSAGLGHWLVTNWVYVVSAASLAFAGVFLVQYGIENGLLPPPLRVLAGIGFGLCLVVAGEWLRRRVGDGEEVSTAYLPSVFAGAGVVSIFAAILAARQLYGLIGAETAFGGHLFAAALAVVLGWFYGPLLAAVGLIGAFVAPFVVASTEPAGVWLYGYFALIAAVGLAVGAVRHWAWVPVLALVLGYAGAGFFALDGGGMVGWIATLVGLAALAVILPELALIPRHAGPSLLQAALLRNGVRPRFSVILAAAATAASTALLALLMDKPPTEAMLALAALAALAVAYLLWADRAEGLADLAVLPLLGFWVVLLMQGLDGARLLTQFAALRAAEVPPPMTVSLILAMAVAISLAFAVRSFRAEPLSILHGLGAVLAAPVAAAVLELLWQPGLVIGVYPWALHIMALAAALVAVALRYARLDGEDHRRAAHATLSALSLIALALFLVSTKTALTLALAVLALVAAGLDRRFRLPEMGIFIQIAVAVLGYRLLVDPGLAWAMEAPLSDAMLGYGGVIAALLAAIWQLRDLERVVPKGVLESAVAGFAAVLANILITRWILGAEVRDDGAIFTHWGMTLNAMPWLVLMLMQIYRAQLGGPLRRLRLGTALLAGIFAAGGLAVAAVSLNPLFAWQGNPDGLVRGPMILDTLALAYGLPGLVMLAAALRLPGVGRRLKLAFAALGAAFVALYVGLEIRRFWQGDFLGGPGVEQGELYAYTVAMMLLGAGLLYQAIASRSAMMRRIAMAVIALTVAKVFLLDAAGLTGLTRVVSFLGLGLSLAGLAWLNRWAGKALAE